MLEWLPPDTETIVALTRPAQVKTFRTVSTLGEAAQYDVASIGLPDEGKDFEGMQYDFIVDGSGNFRRPADLGLWPYAGCKIVALSPTESSRLEALVKTKANRTITVQDSTAYVMDLKNQGDQWHYSLVFTGGFLFCATDKGVLSEVLARRSGERKGRALPKNLPEWRYIDRTAPFWAVRHLTAKSKRWGAWVNMGDDKLTGLAVALDKEARGLVVVSLSQSPDGLRKATSVWQGSMKQEKGQGLLGIAAISPGATRVTFDAQAKDVNTVPFLLILALGHPVFI